MSFIGRGEPRAKTILERLLDCKARTQVPIQSLITKERFELLGEIYNKHKFDIVLDRKSETIVCEVNFKHGDGAYSKWNNVFAPDLLASGKIPLTIDDYSCRKLFNTKNERPLNWNDFRDVIDHLEMVRIQP